jgi:hypothetical protein
MPRSLNVEIEGNSKAVDDDWRIDLSLSSFCRNESMMFDSAVDVGFTVALLLLKNGRLFELPAFLSLNSIAASALSLSSFFAAIASTFRVPAEFVRYFLLDKSFADPFVSLFLRPYATPAPSRDLGRVISSKKGN